jgi:hypothetical protein
MLYFFLKFGSHTFKLICLKQAKPSVLLQPQLLSIKAVMMQSRMSELKRLGDLDGVDDGATEGAKMGAVDGSAEGVIMGALDGREDGDATGAADGCTDGASIGRSDG